MDKEAAAKPDVVLAAAGDYMIAEIMAVMEKCCVKNYRN
jgi:phosphoketolase